MVSNRPQQPWERARKAQGKEHQSRDLQTYQNCKLQLTHLSLESLIALLEMPEALDLLTDTQINEVGEYRPIEINGEKFFNTGSGKAAAAILSLIKTDRINKRFALDDLKTTLVELQRMRMGSRLESAI